MTKSIAAAYAAYQKKLSTVQGVKFAPDYPVENPNSFPYLEPGPFSGKLKNFTSKGQPNGEHVLRCKIHVDHKPGVGVSKAIEELLPFVERVFTALMYDNYNLDGTVDSIVDLSYSQKPDELAGKATECLQFDLTVQIMGLG